jgi:hypothetical protein
MASKSPAPPYVLPTLLALLVALLAACSATGPGPISWIDRRLDQSHDPLARLQLIAHASSPSRVGSLTF